MTEHPSRTTRFPSPAPTTVPGLRTRFPAGPAGVPRPDDTLDTTAQLLNQITSQLGSQLSRVTLDGRRRPAQPPLVLSAHGSGDPRALETVLLLAERIRELRPALMVRVGHIGLNEPLLDTVLASLDPGRAVLVPLLLGRGRRIKHGLPAAVAAAPHLNASVAAPLGPHPLLVEALRTRLIEAGWPTGGALRRTGAVVLAAAGSSDPRSAADTRRTAEQLSERLGVPVVPAFARATASSASSASSVPTVPTVPAAVRSLAARGRHRTAVAAYFTAPGRLASQCAEAAPWLASAPLGAHSAVARLVLHRYDQALAAPSRPLRAAA